LLGMHIYLVTNLVLYRDVVLRDNLPFGNSFCYLRILITNDYCGIASDVQILFT